MVSVAENRLYNCDSCLKLSRVLFLILTFYKLRRATGQPLGFAQLSRVGGCPTLEIKYCVFIRFACEPINIPLHCGLIPKNKGQMITEEMIVHCIRMILSHHLL